MTPSPCINLPCLVTDVVDGDTLTVEVRLPMRVRLMDCWAPERNEPGGTDSTASLRSLAAGKRGILTVPLEHVDRIDKAMTFGRVLGDVWVTGDDESLAQQQVRLGHATKERSG